MLTARNRQYDLCIPPYRFCQCIVSGCITRMECHDHIHLIHSIIICDIPFKKRQLIVPVFYGKTAAVSDHIFLQIQPDNTYVIFFQFMQIIIHGKCQIRFPASKIKYRQLPPFIQPGQNIFDKLQKTVDLSELVSFRPDDLPIPCHHTQILQKRNRDSLLKNMVFSAVMSQIRLFCSLLLFLSLYCHFSFFAHKHRNVFVYRLSLHLTEFFHIQGNLLPRLAGSQVFMKCLGPCKGFKLKIQRPPFLKRTHLYFYYALFFSRTAYGPAYKIYVQYALQHILDFFHITEHLLLNFFVFIVKQNSVQCKT